jgi:hypothetical protein
LFLIFLKKEKNYYEEFENKNFKKCINAKTEPYEGNMLIIDLEDAKIKIDLEENSSNEAKYKKKENEKEMQYENICKEI